MLAQLDGKNGGALAPPPTANRSRCAALTPLRLSPQDQASVQTTLVNAAGRIVRENFSLFGNIRSAALRLSSRT